MVQEVLHPPVPAEPPPGLAHVAVSSPLPDLEVASPEKTRVVEEVEELLPTPTASAGDLVESAPTDLVEEEAEEAPKDSAVEDSTIFFTEPAPEPAEEAAHVKKESVDLSTLVFTEQQAEEEAPVEEAETKVEAEVSLVSSFQSRD